MEVEQEEAEPLAESSERKSEYATNAQKTLCSLIVTSTCLIEEARSAQSQTLKTKKDFKRQYHIKEFIFGQRRGLVGLAAFPLMLSQLSDKKLGFLYQQE